jgi:superfamily II DNA or RNA helicase
MLKKALSHNNITYSTISGAESNDQKENAKNKYNEGNVQVLLISKAGTEGVDTVATESIFIFEGSQWNEALVEQATARAVRYRSHYHLPKEHQKVWVYRLLVIKKSDEELIKKMNQHKIFNFAAINKIFIQQSKEISQLKHNIDLDDDINSFVTNNKNIPRDMAQTIKDKIEFKREEYRKLSPEQKQEYISKIKYNRYETENKINKLFNERPSIEARLTVLSLAK